MFLLSDRNVKDRNSMDGILQAVRIAEFYVQRDGACVEVVVGRLDAVFHVRARRYIGGGPGRKCELAAVQTEEVAPVIDDVNPVERNTGRRASHVRDIAPALDVLVGVAAPAVLDAESDAVLRS